MANTAVIDKLEELKTDADPADSAFITSIQNVIRATENHDADDLLDVVDDARETSVRYEDRHTGC